MLTNRDESRLGTRKATSKCQPKIALSKRRILSDYLELAETQIKALKQELAHARNQIKKLSGRDTINFYAGVISAIAVVSSYGEDSIVDAIVHTCDEEQLISAARANGDMRWSGLDKYLRRKKCDHPDLVKKAK